MHLNYRNRIHKINRDFWWGKLDRDGRYLASIIWDRICKPKIDGGLGFRKASDHNRAMPFKMAWVLTQDSKSLASSMLRKYIYIYMW